MPKTNLVFGLMIDAGPEHCFWRVKVRVMMRRKGEDYPTNVSCSGWDHAEEYERADLVLQGNISNSTGEIYVDNPCYQSAHRINFARAKGMAAMLSRMSKAMVAADSSEPGDLLTTFALYTFYGDVEWHFLPINRALDQFRTLLLEANQEWRLSNVHKQRVLAAPVIEGEG
jgi:hypothetical protein